MKLGIMQPYFFPYIGYFSLIKHVDQFILLDTVQFIRHGWIERNRILKQSGGWGYISVPLEKHGRNCLIKDIKIRDTEDWQKKILSQIVHYKGAPNYYKVRNLITEILEQTYRDIVSCNYYALKTVCRYLDISTPIEIFSHMDIEIIPPAYPDEWALNICKAIPGVTEYWNPEGGVNFFDTKKYENNQLQIRFLKMNLTEYPQKGGEFEPGLSILDILMFNDPETIHQMLDNYVFCEQ